MDIPVSLIKPRWALPVFCFLMSFMSIVNAAPSLPTDMNAMALSTIQDIYNGQYAEAKDEARKIIKRFPAHPAGYFFMAVAVDSWMATHFSDKQEDEFYRYCELAVEKGEKMLERNPDDEWAKFFIGGAEGYKGTYEARFERWITAFRYGWKGVSILLKLQEKKSSIVDLGYGIGSYEYWRSALMKSLWWMPGVEDKRQEGIIKLLKVRNDGVYTRVVASVSLIDIYFNEKKNAEALQIAETALAQYPRSVFFLFGKARALFGIKKYAESETVCLNAMQFLESELSENRAAAALFYYWIAKNDLLLGRYDECLIACDRMKELGFTEDNKKIMQKYFTEIETIRKQAAGGKK